MEIETERLLLIPLTVKQLELLTRDLPGLENELGAFYRAEPMAGIFLEIVLGQLEKAQKDPENALWQSFWALVRKTDRVIVGLTDFKGPPDEKGEVELGYGLGKDFGGNGYMTEAVQSMCAFALGYNDVKAVIAETDADGFASQRILQRCGFAEVSRESTVWWRLQK